MANFPTFFYACQADTLSGYDEIIDCFDYIYDPEITGFSQIGHTPTYMTQSDVLQTIEM